MTDALGASLTFTVRSVSAWPKADLPADAYAPTPERSLILVTCTARDPVTGAHLRNLLVRASA